MRIFATLAPAVVLMASWVPAANAANLLTNSGFETGDFTGWTSITNGAVTSTPGFIPESIQTGTFGARIFPSGQIIQQVLIPNGVDQLRFGGYLRFFSGSSFGGSFDQGQISLGVFPNSSTTLGTQPSGLATSIASNGVNVSDWLFFEGILNVTGLGGQTALLNLNLQNFGTEGDTAVAFDDLFVEAVEVPSPFLLPGLVGLGLGVWRKRRQAE